MSPRWILYGANGYTGRLIAQEAKRQGMSPILAGRNREAIESLARELGLEHRVFDLDSAAQGIQGASVVLHCAGPFSHTAIPMLEACIVAKAHYIDITGEISVFESIHKRDAELRSAGIAALPGAGYDVVPSDCLAAKLKRELPDATQLTLALHSLSGVSRGTLKTMIEGGAHGMIRKNGTLVRVPPAHKTRMIPFKDHSRLAITIPWGDVATAYYSTGVPNIEVYMTYPRRLAKILKSTAFLLDLGPVRAAASRLADWVKGPNENALRERGTSLWGEVRNAKKETRRAELSAPNGYALTAHASLEAVSRFLAEPDRFRGMLTPSMAFGADFIDSLPGVTFKPLYNTANQN